MERVGVSSAAVTKALKGPKACATCAKAKSRCIAGPVGQDKCERCHRLQKPCSSQTPAPPRKRKEPKPTRVAELERRLEDLTARIESVQRLGPGTPSPPDSDHYALPSYAVGAPEERLPPRNFSGTGDPIPTFGRSRWDSPFGHILPGRSIFEEHPDHQQPPLHGEARPPADGASRPAHPGLTSTQTSTAGPMGSPLYQPPSCQLPQRIAGHAWPEGHEAEALLSDYKRHMEHLFPFAIVPPHMSSAQLREQKPFFWKAVMMGASLFDGPRQVALGEELLREVSEAAYAKPQRDLDLLHGLQLLVSWYHYNLSNFQVVNLLFLARSLTSTLGSMALKDIPDNGGYTSECLEQMRAFAGTYYLVTLTFTTHKRHDGLMSTSYLAAFCRALHSQKEYPTDELVVHLVRAQQLSQSISQAFARRNGTPAENQTPQAAFIHSLQDRIRAFTTTLPPHIRADPSLAGHLLVAEILIYENSVQELSHYPSAPKSPGGQDAMTEADPERVEKLWACAHRLHAFVVNRWERESDDYPRFICLSSLDVTYVFLIMLKLMTLQLPGWDLVRLREELRFDHYTTRLLEQMERTAERRKKRRKEGAAGSRGSSQSSPAQMAASVEAQNDEAEDTYAKLARKVRNIKDHLLINGFDGEFASSQVAARVCDSAPMTLADVAQDLMQDLGGGMWEGVMSSPSEWDAVLMGGDTIDWGAVARKYTAPDPEFTITA